MQSKREVLKRIDKFRNEISKSLFMKTIQLKQCVFAYISYLCIQQLINFISGKTSTRLDIGMYC